jgi:HK97 family phage major capsid protein
MLTKILPEGTKRYRRIKENGTEPIGAIYNTTPEAAAFALERGEIELAPDADQLTVAEAGRLLIEERARKLAQEIQGGIPHGLGTQLKRLAFAKTKEARKEKINWPWPARRKTAMTESQSGTLGGYGVGIHFVPEIPINGEENFIRPRARVIPSHTLTQQRPLWTVTNAQSAGVSPFFGGLQFQWTIEATQPGEYEPATSQSELTLHPMTALLIASNAWLADAAEGTIEAQTVALIDAGLHWFEEYAFLHGTGAGQPLGILNSGATIQVPRQTPGRSSIWIMPRC